MRWLSVSPCGPASELMSEWASTASYQSTSFQCTVICEIPQATDGYSAPNPGFPVISLRTLPGGLMDRLGVLGAPSSWSPYGRPFSLTCCASPENSVLRIFSTLLK